MFEILIVDDDTERCQALLNGLGEKKYQANALSLLDKEVMTRLQEHTGLVLILDQDENRINDLLASCPSEDKRILLSNIPIKKQATQHDHVFYLAQTTPYSAIIKQIEALIEIIDSNMLMPVAVDMKSKALFHMLRKIAKSHAPVLINGETGVGKEVIAKYIHHHSLCSSGAFIAVNCAALPENMVEAILFGHEKGAFTGAIQAHPGKFEQAQDGTLLLDEISELPLNLQSKLLRALQEKEIERIGGKKTIAINARIIAASNRDLWAAVNQGQFRKDLFYRLNVIPVHCAPLRERQADIIPLALAFLKKYAAKLEKSLPVLSEDAKIKLINCLWIGNIRELENVIHRAIIICEKDEITADEIILTEQEIYQSTDSNVIGVQFGSKLEASEANAILETLRETDGRRNLAAQKLNISTRALRYKLAKLKEYGIVIP